MCVLTMFRPLYTTINTQLHQILVSLQLNSKLYRNEAIKYVTTNKENHLLTLQ